MIHHFTIARPYARAVFNQALADDQLASWQQVLQVLAVVATDARVRQLLGNPAVTNEMLQQLFGDVVGATLNNVDQAKVNNFIALLADAKRLSNAADINLLYKRLLAQHEGTIEVEVSSAYELSATQQEKIQTQLAAYFSKKVSVQYKIREELIGGVLVRAGNWVMDASIQGKIARLSEQLLA
ncbi:MAG: F0F1 ATP synthase subunit delta [Gammaproteobacteria bacterium]|nr:F0F1 ATP synthase subunit delta [Gammaproteobacteria bacterium]